jgi:hypothetical protein
MMYEQTDIPRTIAELMGFPMATGTGKLMVEIMK